jgi:UPF0271 protein
MTWMVDLNADLGEGCPWDAELMPLVTSVNVACGGHAGDLQTLLLTLERAAGYGLRVGVHPGYPDREHFGRRELGLSEEQIRQSCGEQIEAAAEAARRVGVALRHLKPHGALYHRGCSNAATAETLARLAREWGLALVGLPGSCLAAAADRCGVRYLPEGFADRRYRPDGSLVPRDQPDASILDPAEGAEQVCQLVQRQGVQTVCIHGDGPDPVSYLRRLRQLLLLRGIGIAASG